MDRRPRRVTDRMANPPFEDQTERSSEEATPSDQGNQSGAAENADLYGEGLGGITPLEEEARPTDILPDQIRGAPPDEREREFTAQPSHPVRPIRHE